MGANLTKENATTKDSRRRPKQLSENPTSSLQRFKPDLSHFKGVLGNSKDPLNSYYESANYQLEAESDCENDQTQMGSITTTKGITQISQMRSRTSYVDLDQLYNLENRIESIKEKKVCPVFYLGWTQQCARPWCNDKQPNSFTLAQTRAVVLHLPPFLQRSWLFKSELPQSMLALVNEGCTCGELLDFFNQIIAENLKQKQVTRSSGGARVEIKALRSVTTSSRQKNLYCLDYYLTQPDLPIGRLTMKNETHLVPIVYEEQEQNLVGYTGAGKASSQMHNGLLVTVTQKRLEAHVGDKTPTGGKNHDFLTKFSTGGHGVTNYELLTQVGKGGFSRVILTRQKSSGVLCAMKVISIEELLSHGKFKQIVLERKILSQLQHPCIVNFVEAFRTQKFLHLVLDFCPAGELFYHLSKQKKLGEADAKIIIAEIILALEHLHKYNITYRDLKPENIIVDFNGHVKLTDFGLCKQRLHKDDISKSLCGSPEYICPEMLNTGVHTRMVDFYQVGALLFELLTGLPPNYSKNKQVMFDRISKQEVVFPTYISSMAKDLLTKLLKKDPKKRLGYKDGFHEVRSSPFFANIDWQELIEQKRPGPLKPHLSGSYFDQEFVEELSSEAVLEMTQEWTEAGQGGIAKPLPNTMAIIDDTSSPSDEPIMDVAESQEREYQSRQRSSTEPKRQHTSHKSSSVINRHQKPQQQQNHQNQTVQSHHDGIDTISFQPATKEHAKILATAGPAPLDQRRGKVTKSICYGVGENKQQFTNEDDAVRDSNRNNEQSKVKMKNLNQQLQQQTKNAPRVGWVENETSGAKADILQVQKRGLQNRIKPQLSPMLTPLPQPSHAVTTPSNGNIASLTIPSQHQNNTNPAAAADEYTVQEYTGGQPKSSDDHQYLFQRRQGAAEIQAGSGQMPTLRHQTTTSSPDVTLSDEDESAKLVQQLRGETANCGQLSLIKRSMQYLAGGGGANDTSGTLINPFLKQSNAARKIDEEKKLAEATRGAPANFYQDSSAPPNQSLAQQKKTIIDHVQDVSLEEDFSPVRNERSLLTEEGIATRQLNKSNKIRKIGDRLPKDAIMFDIDSYGGGGRATKGSTPGQKRGVVQKLESRIRFKQAPLTDNKQSALKRRKLRPSKYEQQPQHQQPTITCSSPFQEAIEIDYQGGATRFPKSRQSQIVVPSMRISQTQLSSYGDERLITIADDDTMQSQVNDFSRTQQPKRVLGQLMKFVSERRREAAANEASNQAATARAAAKNASPTPKSRQMMTTPTKKAQKSQYLNKSSSTGKLRQSSVERQQQKQQSIQGNAAQKPRPSLPAKTEIIPGPLSPKKSKLFQNTIIDTEISAQNRLSVIPCKRKLHSSFTEKKLNTTSVNLAPSAQMRRIPLKMSRSKVSLNSARKSDQEWGDPRLKRSTQTKPQTPVKTIRQKMFLMPNPQSSILKNHENSAQVSPSKQFLKEVPLRERLPSQGMPSPGRQTPRASSSGNGGGLTSSHYVASVPLKTATCASQCSISSSRHYLDVPVAKKITSISKIEKLSTSVKKSRLMMNKVTISQIPNFSPQVVSKKMQSSSSFTSSAKRSAAASRKDQPQIPQSQFITKKDNFEAFKKQNQTDSSIKQPKPKSVFMTPPAMSIGSHKRTSTGETITAAYQHHQYQMTNMIKNASGVNRTSMAQKKAVGLAAGPTSNVYVRVVRQSQQAPQKPQTGMIGNKLVQRPNNRDLLP